VCSYAVLLQSKHHENNVFQTFVKKPRVQEKYTKWTKNIKLTGYVLDRKKT
jgi:hypothetical protein